MTLQDAAKKFIAIKRAQQLAENTIYDYLIQLTTFINASHNSVEYTVLEKGRAELLHRDS